MTNVVWVLVANTSYAQIFKVKGHGKEIDRIHHLKYPDGRKKSGAIISDRPGRAFDRFGAGRHGMSTRMDLRGRQQQVFAHQIVEILKKGKDAHAFSELVIIAPAHFLGEIQSILPSSIKKLLTEHIAHDLPSYLNEADVINYICTYLDLWNVEKAS